LRNSRNRVVIRSQRVAQRRIRLPSLSFGDGMQEENGSGRYVGVGGCGAFPPVRPVLGTVGGLDAGLFEELPNELAAFGAVVIQCAKRATM
jgi:hypothetical protein